MNIKCCGIGYEEMGSYSVLFTIKGSSLQIVKSKTTKVKNFKLGRDMQHKGKSEEAQDQ